MKYFVYIPGIPGMMSWVWVRLPDQRQGVRTPLDIRRAERWSLVGGHSARRHVLGSDGGRQANTTRKTAECTYIGAGLHDMGGRDYVYFLFFSVFRRTLLRPSSLFWKRKIYVL